MIDKKRLQEIAEPLSAEARETMQTRKADRYWRVASSAIAAKVLRQLRVKGMTRVQLAEALNVTPANITRYLNGKCNFELRTLVELERVLDVHIIDREVIPTKN